MDAWKNYDKWKTTTPWDNEPDVELFETFEGKVKYFSHDEKACEKFDKEAKELAENPDYDDEDMNDELEELAYDYGLKDNEADAIIAYLDEMEAEKLDAEIARAEYLRDLKNNS